MHVKLFLGHDQRDTHVHLTLHLHPIITVAWRLFYIVINMSKGTNEYKFIEID